MAFVFGLLAYWLTKLRERYVLHNNALVKLERALTRQINQFAILSGQIDGIRHVLEDKLPADRLLSLNLPGGLDIDLGSIDLINKLFLYQFYLDRLDVNISSFNHALDRFEDIRLAGIQLHPDNLEYANKMLSNFKSELSDLEKKAIEFLAYVNINSKKLKEREIFFHRIFHSKWDFEVTQKEVDSEAEKLITDMVVNNPI